MYPIVNDAPVPELLVTERSFGVFTVEPIRAISLSSNGEVSVTPMREYEVAWSIEKTLKSRGGAVGSGAENTDLFKLLEVYNKLTQKRSYQNEEGEHHAPL